ncbi:hypothetical protein C2G38_2142452 [Gigaspora rosea]|uniref:Uncharacterized protein n=1 Tax=Gigaspora rosea TaxID=44941 RepID=A0A397V8W5_9GLOM|nr:hypothetical protein C2G38_2142452 [Gigaspora rosea]
MANLSEVAIDESKLSDLSEVTATQSEILTPIEQAKTFITLVCFDRFEKPHKKLDGALAIPYDLDSVKSFGDVEENILSRTLPEQWGRIKLGHICYQTSKTMKADHYDLKSDGAIIAFISEIKCKKNLQLCVYQENDEITRASKRIRTLETESDTMNTLNNIKKKLYDNLPSCDIHVQGCLISDNGKHLKLDGDLITLWARAILIKMQGVDELTPPNIPSFDKNKYRYPTSKRSLSEVHSESLIDTTMQSTTNSTVQSVTNSAAISTAARSTLYLTLHTKKKSPLKSNIYITNNMTFQNLLNYVFPNGPPSGKRFIIKSSLEIGGQLFLPDQIINQVFKEAYSHIWIDLEDVEVKLDDLF